MFLIGQSNEDEQTEKRDDMLCRGTSTDNASKPAQIYYPQLDTHTLEENIVSKVRSELDKVMTSVETRVQDAVLTAIENWIIPGVELAMKLANAHSERSVEGNILEPDQRDFLSDIEGLRMTAISRVNSPMDLNGIDEIRGNTTVRVGFCLWAIQFTRVMSKIPHFGVGIVCGVIPSGLPVFRISVSGCSWNTYGTSPNLWVQKKLVRFRQGTQDT